MTRILLRNFNGLIVLLVALVAIAVQSSLLSIWPISVVQPDFVLIFTLWMALKRRFIEGGFLTLGLAYLAETHSSATRGTFFVAYMSVFLLVHVLVRYWVIDTLRDYAILASVAMLVLVEVKTTVLSLLGLPSASPLSVIFTWAPAAGLEGLVAYWGFKALDRLDWVTFKNPRAYQALEEELQLEPGGF